MLIEDQLTYNPDTGLFKWLEDNHRKKKGWFSGTDLGNGYLVIKINNKVVRTHRLAWYLMNGAWPKQQIDHIDGNNSNNKLSNLRDVSPAENSQNRRKVRPDSKTGVLGVSYRRERYVANIKINGERKCLGTFDTPEQSHQAYLEAKRKYHKGNTL